jgi:hypothetical protein
MSIRFTKLGGRTVLADTALYQAPKISCLFEADAAITVGKCVAIDTGNLTAALVVTCPAAATADHRALGIYEGEGGSGAKTTVSGLSGRDAADADQIWITMFGLATALVDGDTTDATDGDALTPSVAVAGELQSLGTTFAAGAKPIFTCLEANTSTVAAKKVFVRGL